MWEPKSLRGNHKSLIIIVFQQQMEGGNNPLATMNSIIQLKIEGGYNPLIYKLQPEGIPISLNFLAPSCHLDMNIETVEPWPHWSYGHVNQQWYYTTQTIPHFTTIATINHYSPSDHYSSTDHFPLYHIAHQLVQSTCPIRLYQSIFFSHHLTHPIWV